MVGPAPLREIATQPGLSHAFGDGEAQRAHFAGQLRRRARFLETQFGMGMNVLVERQQMGVIGRDFGVHA